MKLIIDRFENEFAVLELDNGSFENLPKTLLPTGTKEGDCIIIEISKDETSVARKRIEKKMNKLFVD